MKAAKLMAFAMCILALVSCRREGFTEEESHEDLPQLSQVEVVEDASDLKPSESEEVSEPSKEEPTEEEKIFSKDSWELILVNRDHLIPDDFEVALNSVQGYYVDNRIKEPYLQMYNAAKEEGIDLLLCYGYRTKEQSQALFEKQIGRQLSSGLSYEAAVEEAKKWVAPPGTSEHHTGLALDIVTPAYQILNHDFMKTDAAVWMKENAHRFGFILRYPEDKEEITGITFEPWHYRYVGKDAAEYIYENNLCLEEFLEGDNVQ